MKLRAVLVAVVTVVLVATAGCLGTIGLDDGSGDGGDDDEGLPPGVSGDGLDNASRLVEAHDAALEDEGYVSETVSTLSFADGPDGLTATIRRSARVSEGGVPYRLVRNNTGGLSEDFEKVAWANESVELVREESHNEVIDDEVTYRRNDGGAATVDYGLREFLQYFFAGDWTTTSTDGDRIRLEADAVDPDAGADADGMTDYQGEVILDRSGRIRSGRIDVKLPSEQGTIVATVEYDLELTPVTVDRPDWVGEGLRASAAIALETTVVGDAVEVTNEGREPIPAGYVIKLAETSQTSSSLAELDAPVEPGESVYLTLDGTRTLLHRSEPSGDDPLSGTYEVTLHEDDLDVIHRERIVIDD